MKKTSLSILLGVITLIFFGPVFSLDNGIIPYKFTDKDNVPVYEIPTASRFSIKRFGINKPDIF